MACNRELPRVYCSETSTAGCARLNAAAAANVVYLPFALAETSGPAKLYETGSCSRQAG